MTSRQQAARDRYDHILPFIEEAADEYYGGNLDQGFCHWAFATVFAVGHDVQGNDIVEATAIDGADDFEIDGYFIPESDDDSVVHLFQSKHRQPPGTTMGPRELAAFLNAPNRLLNVQEVAACRNDETKALHDELVKRLKSRERRCSINLVWVTSGTISATARRHAEENRSRKLTAEISGNPMEVTVTLECLDLADLHQQHINQQTSDDRFQPCDFTFEVEPGSFHQTDASDYRTLSMTVPVKHIIDVFAVHSYKIFRENPRGPLGNKVNTSIKRTLLDEIDRRRFHLLNNGITAICESYRLDGNQLDVRDFQIINGCQTAVTLWDARAAVRDDPSVLVSVKLTECPRNFAQTIATTTNRQAALRAEDFISNDDVQNRLQREFNTMVPPWFYEIKRGEWSKMLGGTSVKEGYRNSEGGYRKLTSKEVAQAVVSFAGFPGEAKDNIRSFLNKTRITSLSREGEFSYDAVYTESITAGQLLLPAVIQREVWKQATKDKSNEPWVEYARFHIVWLIAEILREHYNLDGRLFPFHQALSLAEEINNWFSPIYGVAKAAIRNGLQESERRDEFTGYREFFRTPANYRLIESNLHGALQLARNFGNPLERLPPP